MSNIRAVLFDKDGTLLDFQATWGRWAAALLRDLSGGDPEVLRALARLSQVDPEAETFSQNSVFIAGTPDDIVSTLLPALPGSPDPVALGARLAQDGARVAPAPIVPMEPLFDGLEQSGIRVGIVTNDSEEAAYAHMVALGVENRIGFFAGYDSGYGAKPEPGQILGACEVFGITPAEAVMVGDSLHDLRAAEAAGSPGVGVLTGTADREMLTPHATVVLPDVGHLIPWISEQLVTA